MKVCVYAIAKNEEKFVDRWVSSMMEADHICVLDTGSEDGTVEKLADWGVTVKQECIAPWRFDAARKPLPGPGPGGRGHLRVYGPGRVFPPRVAEGAGAGLDGGHGAAALHLHLELRRGWAAGAPPSSTRRSTPPGVFEWEHPVHEVLRRTDGKKAWKVSACPEIVLEHHPDLTKSRAGYLPLLELSVREARRTTETPTTWAGSTCSGGRWDEAIAQLKAHLQMPTATWEPERCASMRFLSRCYLSKGDRRGGHALGAAGHRGVPGDTGAVGAGGRSGLCHGELVWRVLLRFKGAGDQREIRHLHQRGQGLGRLPVGRHGVCGLSDGAERTRRRNARWRRCVWSRTTSACRRTWPSSGEVGPCEDQGRHRLGRRGKAQRLHRAGEV